MKIVKWRFPYSSRRDTFRIIGLGDIHWGHVHCAERVFRNTVKAIAEDDSAYWIGMGDYTDGISVYDKYYNPDALHPRYRDMPRAVRALEIADVGLALRPIADKCLGMLEGNHNCIRTAGGQRIIEPEAPQVARMMGKDDEFIDKAVAEDMLIVVMIFGWENRANKWTVKLNASHGVQAGRKPGGAINRIGDILASHDVHVVFRGHNHQRGGWSFQRIEYVGDDYHPFAQDRVGGYTGSFLKAYEVDGFSYAAAKDFPANTIGSWGVSIMPDKRRIWMGAEYETA